MTISEFQSNNLHFSDYESEMERYERLEAEIMELPSSQYLNAAIQLSTDPLKLALAVEAKAWKTAYGRGLNSHYRTSMETTVQFVTDYSKKLARPIKVINGVGDRLRGQLLQEGEGKNLAIHISRSCVSERGHSK